MTGLVLDLPAGPPRRYPARHEVIDALLVSGSERIPVVVKKIRLDTRQRLLGSKGERSFRNAKALLERGLPTPEPFGFEVREGESWFVARRVEGAVQIREWFLHRDDPARFPAPALPVSFERAVEELGRLARRMHDSGVFFRDFSDGNVLVSWDGDAPKLWLVDLNRVRISDRPVGRWSRLRDLARPGLNRSEDAKLLLESYFGGRPASPGTLVAVRLLRRRIVFWNGLKKRLRPWRHP